MIDLSTLGNYVIKFYSVSYRITGTLVEPVERYTCLYSNVKIV